MDREWGVLKIGQFSWTSYVYHPLDETESMRDHPQDNTLNIDQSCNTLWLPLTDKTKEKHGDKVLNNSINEIRSQLKTLTISIKQRLTFAKNQMRETRNGNQLHTPMSMNNRTNDTTQ